MARKGTENLKPQSKRTKEEQRKIASSGGLASGKARREKRLIKDRLELLLSLPADGDAKADNGDAMCAAILRKALSGDVQAFTAIRDSIGEKPTDKSESNINGKLDLSVSPAFVDALNRLKRTK